MQALFTQYWHFLAVQNACKINLFDLFVSPNTIENFCKQSQTQPVAVQFLVNFLTEEEYLYQITASNEYICSPKGLQLCDNQPNGWKNACILWGEEHLNAWQGLDYTLKTAQPAFERAYNSPFFAYLQDKPNKLANYHLAMAEYAREDYAKVGDFLTDLPTITADIGGGLGVLIKNLAKTYPDKKFILADLPEVLNLATAMPENVELKPLNFFQPFLFAAEAIILARVLHDWDDQQAGIILNNCYNALPQGGKLYVFELMQDEIKANLLSLNMLLMCKSHERSGCEYKRLLNTHNFEIVDKKLFNNLQTLTICKRM
jgi:C-methyltransferase